LTPTDKAMHNGLLKLLNEASFTLKAKEVSAFASIYKWVQDMPENLESKKPVVDEKKKVNKK